MNLLLIGHSVEDHIIKQGKEVIQPGGIYYSALAAVNIKTDDDKIFLHTAVKKEDKLFEEIYSQVKGKYIEYREEIPAVYLTIHENKEREERYSGLSGALNIPLEYEEKLDGILINMITGFDIGIEHLIKIRKAFGGLIYLDIHSLSRGVNEKIERIFRPVPEKEKWLGNVDILQTNENEIFTLSNSKKENIIAREILDFGVKLLIVTKGGLGVKVYYKKGDETESLFISAEKIIVKNKIGCGDIFGTVFFYNYIKDTDLMNALLKANKAAGTAVSYDDVVMFKNFKNDVS